MFCAVAMRRVNALELRQSLGKVLGLLQRSGQPVVIEKRGREVAVLISLRDFRERFSEKAAADERDRLIAEMDALAASATVVDKTPATQIIREMRGYDD
jgi:prevent-host-death family protein